jgi:hypothetical protein
MSWWNRITDKFPSGGILSYNASASLFLNHNLSQELWATAELGNISASGDNPSADPQPLSQF